MTKTLIYIPGYRYGGIETTFELMLDNYNYQDGIVLLVEKQADVSFVRKRYPDLLVVVIPDFSLTNFWGYIRSLVRVFRENSFITVVAYNYIRIPFFFFIAKKFHVSHRIYHARTNLLSKNRVKDSFLHLWVDLGAYFATDKLACSRQAGKYFFRTRSFVVQKNAIDTKEFQYNEKERLTVRRDLGIDTSTFIIGHVGRFCIAKNHRFIIDTFSVIKKRLQNSKLLLVGDGPLMDDIKEYARSKHVFNDIFFLGKQHNASIYYQAMDVFLFPSIYEGFGNVALEAQASGLKVCASDVVSEETKVTPNIVYIPLSEDCNVWVSECLSVPPRSVQMDRFIDSGYDVSVNIKNLISNYKLPYEI